jgi:hypothetical protein
LSTAQFSASQIGVRAALQLDLGWIDTASTLL